MALAIWQRTIQDGSGNALGSAFVEVRLKVTGLPLATIYSDRDGNTPKSNPFQADSGGFAAFYTLGGLYRIRAYKTIGLQLYERVWDDVGIGTNSEHDFGTAFVPRGPWVGDSPGDVYQQGDVVSHQVVGSEIYAFASNENENTGNEPVFSGSPLMPESDEHWTVLGLLEAPGTPGADGQGLNPRGEWDNGGTYAIGDFVQFNDRTFVSLQDGNINHEPPDAEADDAFWMWAPTVAGADGEVTSAGAAVAGNLASFTDTSGDEIEDSGVAADEVLVDGDIGSTVQAHSAVLDATTASFLTADETKLDGIEAGADVTDAGNVGAAIHGASAKTTPVDADTIPTIDSEASNVLKKVTWTNIKAFLKTYFDTLYQPIDAALTALAGGSDFVAFSGPASSVKTFSLPDASQGIATLSTENQALVGGATVTEKALSDPTNGGTVTLDMGDRPIQKFTNNVAGFTLAPGTVHGMCIVDITNGASAGTITTSGWTKKSGDAFTTTNGHKFRCHCSVGTAGSLLVVQALQ